MKRWCMWILSWLGTGSGGRLGRARGAGAITRTPAPSIPGASTDDYARSREVRGLQSGRQDAGLGSTDQTIKRRRLDRLVRAPRGQRLAVRTVSHGNSRDRRESSGCAGSTGRGDRRPPAPLPPSQPAAATGAAARSRIHIHQRFMTRSLPPVGQNRRPARHVSRNRGLFSPYSRTRTRRTPKAISRPGRSRSHGSQRTTRAHQVAGTAGRPARPARRSAAASRPGSAGSPSSATRAVSARRPDRSPGVAPPSAARPEGWPPPPRPGSRS